jgi:hypothetical protein
MTMQEVHRYPSGRCFNAVSFVSMLLDLNVNLLTTTGREDFRTSNWMKREFDKRKIKSSLFALLIDPYTSVLLISLLILLPPHSYKVIYG